MEALSTQVLLFQDIHLKSCGTCVMERSPSTFSSVKQRGGARARFTTAGLNNKTQITKLKPPQHFLYWCKGELDADS